MEKEFVSFKQALALKELGFNEPCFVYFCEDIGYQIQYKNPMFLEDFNSRKGMYLNDVSAPTYSQAFRWFREKHDLQCWPEPTGSNRYSCRYDGNDNTGYRWVGYLRDIDDKIYFYEKYEEAESACLDKLIEIVKNK